MNEIIKIIVVTMIDAIITAVADEIKEEVINFVDSEFFD